MKIKLLHQGEQRTFAVVLDTGDEVVECLGAFARQHNLSAASFSGIGAFSDVVLGFFDWEDKDYRRIAIGEQVEVVALLGDIALGEDGPKLHPHIVVAKSDGTAHGGHLMAGRVRPTLEVVVTESPAHLHRKPDPTTGLALIRI